MLTGVGDAAARRAERKAFRAAAPTPERHPSYDHLTLEQVRGVRDQLLDLEIQVAHWQHVLRARIVVLRSAGPKEQRVADHTRSLAQAVHLRRRLQNCDVWSTDDVVAVPDLVEAWSRAVAGHDADGVDRLCADLQGADSQLGLLLVDLRARHGLATIELLARYRTEPGLALHLLTR